MINLTHCDFSSLSEIHFGNESFVECGFEVLDLLVRIVCYFGCFERER